MATILKAGNVASGAQITSDATGILEIRTGTGAGTTAITVGTNQAVTMAGAVSSSSLTVNSNNISAVNSLGFRNRIINGDMRIDQRNNGASSALASAVYSLDRYMGFFSSSGTATVQRSSAAPTGFVNSLLVTVGTADSSVAAGDYAEIEQRIEGFNVADLGFGTASAQTVTLSFWVRSSVTGTYCVNFRNNGNNRAYVVNYTINAANTWEYKTVTITGDTSGTWTTDNSSGLIVGFCLMVGSTFQQAAGSWGSTSFGFGSSSQTNLMATSGATFYITGVQLEAGSVATPFERRDYGRELIMCQRYYQGNKTDGTAGTAGSLIVRGSASTTGAFYYWVPFAVQMRAAPTMNIGTPSYTNSNTAQLLNPTASGVEVTISVTSGGGFAFIPWRADIEL